jgi:hypothetical protein
LRSASRSSVFALDFFHSWLGFGRGRDNGGDVPAADLAVSSRDLFFPPAVFKLFDGEGFILQVHRVFTCIRSGAKEVVSGGGALRSTLSSEMTVCTGGGVLGTICSEWLQVREVKNPKGFGFYL